MFLSPPSEHQPQRQLLQQVDHWPGGHPRPPPCSAFPWWQPKAHWAEVVVVAPMTGRPGLSWASYRHSGPRTEGVNGRMSL